VKPAWEEPEFLKSAVVVEAAEAPSAAGQILRTRLLRVGGKYPLILVEETVETRAATGEEFVSRRSMMAGDHILVGLQSGMTEADLEAYARSQGGSIRKRLYRPGYYLVSFPSPTLSTVRSMVGRFQSSTNLIRSADPDYICLPQYVPNDTRFSEQWGLHQSSDVDIDAVEAWDFTAGNTEIVVGVIDTGVDYGHPDLAANIWINPGEVPDNGIDDDGNGLVDDVRGWDFGDDDNDPMDTYSHGTHCAGIIAAVGDNGIGVVGVAWKARIMPLKASLGSLGSLPSSAIVDAIHYATRMGVDLTSNSYGGPSYFQPMKDAIDEAGAQNILFVASAGNDSEDTDTNPQYPSAYTSANIISVAASDREDNLADFSNFGAASVDLAAPGVDILSTVLFGVYGWKSGTSMATPFVAGACALHLARAAASGGGRTSIHQLSAASGFKDFVLRKLTGLSDMGDNSTIAMASNGDVVQIHTEFSDRTGLRRVSAASNYEDMVLDIRTGLHHVDFPLWRLLLAPNGDLVAINTQDGGKTAIHFLSAASNYQQFALQTKTALHAVDDTWLFAMAPNNDLIAINTQDGNRTSLHRLSAASNYQQFVLQVHTPLAATDSARWQFFMAQNGDLVGVNTQFPRNEDRTQIQRFSAAANFQQRVYTHSTALPRVDRSWTFALAPNDDLAAFNKRDFSLPPIESVRDAILANVTKLDSLAGKCVTGGRLNIFGEGNLAPPPDLSIRDSTLSAYSFSADDSVTLTANVESSGLGPAGASVLQWYISTDATITADDYEWCSLSLPAFLGLSGGLARTQRWPGALGPGTYRVAVVADAFQHVSEANEDNNRGFVYTVTVGTSGTELRVDASSMSTLVVTPGLAVDLADTVRNTGTKAAARFDSNWTISTDPDVTSDDTFWASRTIENLAPGQTSQGNGQVTWPATGLLAQPGTYYVACHADPLEQITEGNESDNRGQVFTVRVEGTPVRPDLTFAGVSASPLAVVPGGNMAISFNVYNQGDGLAAWQENGEDVGFFTQWYISPDPQVTTSDSVWDFSFWITLPLPPGELAFAEGTLRWPSTGPLATPGTYYVAAITDYEGVIVESDESNNVGPIFVVCVGNCGAPDLVLTAASFTPRELVPGDMVDISDTVVNRGTAGAGGFWVTWYISQDSHIDVDDYMWFYRRVDLLPAGQETVGSGRVEWPSWLGPGAYHVGVIADDESEIDESSDGNNLGVEVAVSVVPGTPSIRVAPSLLVISNDPPAQVAAPAALRQQLEQAAAAGLKVKMVEASGVPSSIRGSDLSATTPFSGGKLAKLRTGADARERALVVLDNLAGLYRLRDAGQEFKTIKTQREKNGSEHVRLAQRFRGLRVEGAHLTVHFDKSGKPYQVNGRYVPGLDLDVAPSMDASAAARVAQAHLAQRGRLPGKVFGEPELLVFAPRDGEARLAYEVKVHQDEAGYIPARWVYLIDARNGSVLRAYDDVQDINAPTDDGDHAEITGTGLVSEGGTDVSVVGWMENQGPAYYLYNRPSSWYVFNAAATGYPDSNTFAHRFSPFWGHSDRTQISAARALNHAQQYFHDVHGRESFDDANAFARADVHFGNGLANAFWFGDQPALAFGDGDGINAGSMAVMDIVGHELTHAVIDHTADLVYFGESGALNESFADIFGSLIEFHAQPAGTASYPAATDGHDDWLIGEDCWMDGTALRDLRHPSSTATLAEGYQQPSRYRGTHWFEGTGDNGGIHINSGVQNFFFYLLCEGGTGNNDGIDYDLSGLGIENAQHIAYRAMTVYCAPNSNYEEVRDSWIWAAEDLNPAWVPAVNAAWNAVGVYGDDLPKFRISNTGKGELNVTAMTASQPWIEVNPSSVTVPIDDQADVLVVINWAEVPVGNHSETITIASNDPDKPEVQLPVTIVNSGMDDVPPVFTSLDPDHPFLFLGPHQEVELFAPATDPDGGGIGYHWLVDQEVQIGVTNKNYIYFPGSMSTHAIGAHLVTVKASDDEGNVIAHDWHVAVGEGDPTLLGWWNFNDGSGADQSGWGSDLSMTGSVKVIWDGMEGKSLEFVPAN